MTLPSQMRAAVLTGFDDPKTQLIVQERPLPTPRHGEVLVRMHASPINPSDLVFLRNQYGIRKTLPVVPGLEGSGTVVKSNAGLLGQWLMGKRVACRASETGDGTWAEYMATPANACIPLKSNVTLDEGATLIVNPITAWALLDQARLGRHRALIQTAAASAIGRMIGRLARHQFVKMIHLVRRAEHVTLLRNDGAEYVIDMSEEGSDATLRTLARELGTTLAFDAVGGPLTARVASALPRHSKILVYGGLSGEPCTITPSSLIFEGKTLSGFWLTEWIKTQGFFSNLGMIRQIQTLLGTVLRTSIQGRSPLSDIQTAMALYKKNRSDGKVLLTL